MFLLLKTKTKVY